MHVFESGAQLHRFEWTSGGSAELPTSLLSWGIWSCAALPSNRLPEQQPGVAVILSTFASPAVTRSRSCTVKNPSKRVSRRIWLSRPLHPKHRALITPCHNLWPTLRSTPPPQRMLNARNAVRSSLRGRGRPEQLEAARSGNGDTLSLEIQ